MSPCLKISNLLIERFEKLENGCVGHLFGIRSNATVLLLSLDLSGSKECLEEDKKGDEFDFRDGFGHDMITNLPGGIDLLGIIEVTDHENLNCFDEDLLDELNELSVVVNINEKSKKLITGFYRDGKCEETEFAVIDEKEIANSYAHLRLTASFPLRSDIEICSVETALDDLEKKVLSDNAAFRFEESNVYLLGDENVCGISCNSTLSELLTLVKGPEKNKSENVILNVGLLVNQTFDQDSPLAAPYIKYVKKEFKHAEIQFTLDALVMASKSLPVVRLHRLLVDGARRNFALNKENLLDQLEMGKTYDVSPPETYHFFPSPLGHFLSLVYSKNQKSDDLRRIRESFHRRLSLPMDRPLFRQANARDLSESARTESHLILNPHEKVGKSGVVGGEARFVQGRYAYHHYMQDDFDDGGWGCAYRSLQTIFSWFRFQGYTSVPVPTHREIQECLVSIGDKPASFVGSRQWIGSTEVSFVLDAMLGVASRIVSVSSGEEMTTKGGELNHHFRTQGIPVMIGGGVLAHTILGVDYNKNTGDIKFLILDPHYTGDEDLNLILKKGWCGWKGPEFWKKDAFYNMCLPLKPNCV